MREDNDTSTPTPPTPPPFISRRNRRFIKQQKQKELKVASQFRRWENDFSNQFANALANAENHENNIYPIFDRYWRLLTMKGNNLAKRKMFDCEWFQRTHMDNDPNSEINQVD
jgi:hypothetical protein